MNKIPHNSSFSNGCIIIIPFIGQAKLVNFCDKFKGHYPKVVSTTLSASGYQKNRLNIKWIKYFVDKG